MSGFASLEFYNLARLRVVWRAEERGMKRRQPWHVSTTINVGKTRRTHLVTTHLASYTVKIWMHWPQCNPQQHAWYDDCDIHFSALCGVFNGLFSISRPVTIGTTATQCNALWNTPLYLKICTLRFPLGDEIYHFYFCIASRLACEKYALCNSL